LSDGLPPSLAGLTVHERREFLRYVEGMGHTDRLTDPQASADLLWHWRTYTHQIESSQQPTVADSRVTALRWLSVEENRPGQLISIDPFQSQGVSRLTDRDFSGAVSVFV